jgi:hypothetical protein
MGTDETKQDWHFMSHQFHDHPKFFKTLDFLFFIPLKGRKLYEELFIEASP